MYVILVYDISGEEGGEKVLNKRRAVMESVTEKFLRYVKSI